MKLYSTVLSALQSWRWSTPTVPQTSPVEASIEGTIPSIEWHPCLFNQTFDCGSLQTPLDYTNASKDPRKTTIALCRYRAGGGNTSRDEVLGSVILNPGGPGGSGLSFLTRNGTAQELDGILDARYDLVSFDPRGVGATWPRAQCFEDAFENLVFTAMAAGRGVPGAHGSHRPQDFEINFALAQHELLGSVCMRSADAELFRHMSTPFVARDMQILHRALGDARLNYWGFSYGSVLGSTYADMFPEDVERLVIDGVPDVLNYYSGAWSHRLKDVEAEFNMFFEECASAGAPACKLAALGSSGPDLKSTVLKYVDGLAIQPVAVSRADPPQLLTASQLLSTIYGYMYAPKRWPMLASALHDAIALRDAHSLVASIDLHPARNAESEAIYAISCGDAQSQILESGAGWNITKYKEHMAPIRADSPLFAEASGAGARAICAGPWSVRGAERYYGSLNASTSFPLLTLGNDFDPATPGRYADAVAAGFTNAVSVRRAGYGHCSSSQRSSCIERIVRDYFLLGKLPDAGTHCAVDEPIFSNPPGMRTESAVALAIMEAGNHWPVRI